MSHSRSTARKRIGALFTSLATAFALVVPLAGPAAAAPPSVGLLSPAGSFSESPEGSVHFTAWATGDNTITQVQFKLTCGTEEVFNAADNTAPYEAEWVPSGVADGTACDAEATAVDNEGLQTTDTDSVTYNNPPDDGVEIHDPAHGGDVTIYSDGTNDHMIISGVAGPDAAQVLGEFSTAAEGTADPAFTICGVDSTDNDPATPEFEYAIQCTAADLSGVTAAGALTDAGWDRHAVTTVNTADPQLFNVTAEPDVDSAAAGVVCNEYTVTVTADNGAPVAGVNVDIHATGPTDALAFATTDDTSAFRAPLDGTHGDYEDTADCTAGDPDAQDDAGDTEGANPVGVPVDETAAANLQGVHTDAGADTKHIEGETDEFGQFTFAIYSPDAGDTALEIWADTETEDDVNQTQERDTTASKTWYDPVATTLDAEPESDFNNVGQNHTVTSTVTDQNGQPFLGADVQLNVVSGPNDDEGPSTNNCETDASGECEITYTGDGGAGTDDILVWVNTNDSRDITDGADAAEPQDEVTKTWVEVPADACLDAEPEDALNPTTESHEMVATLTSSGGDTVDDDECGGDPLPNTQVDVEITDDTPDAFISSVNGEPTTGEPDTATGLTDENGQISVTIELAEGADISADSTNEIHFAVTGSGHTDATVGEDDDDQADLVQKRWAEVGEPAELDVTPELDTNERGTAHELTAMVLDAFGTPVTEDQTVNFQVISGPNAGTSFSCDTGDNGTCTESYTDSGAAEGIDNIRAWVDGSTVDTTEGPDEEATPGTQPEPDLTDVVRKQWLDDATAAAVAIDMDGCNGSTVDLTDASWDEEAENEVGNRHEVCATAVNADGTVLLGREIDYESLGVGHLEDADGNELGTSTAVAIGHDEYAHVWLQSTQTGDQDVTASMDDQSDTGTKTWTPGNARNIDLQPDMAINAPGDIHEVTATVTDRFGNAVPGVDVDFTEEGTGRFTNGTSAAAGTTNASGQVTAEVTTQQSEDGRQFITGTIDDGTTDCDLEADDPDEGDPAGNCEDTVEKIWGAEIEALEPLNQTVTAGEPVCLPIQVNDTDGDPIEGAEVAAELTGANEDEPITGQTGPCGDNGTTQQSTGEAVTDEDGIASFIYTPQNAGTDTITIWADFDGDGVLDDGEPSVTYTITVVEEEEPPPGEDQVIRFPGSDRMHTAILTSQDRFPDEHSADAVVLARSDDFPDALAGTPLAVNVNAPLLLTPSPENWAARGQTDHIWPDTLTEIDRVLADGGTVVILGRELAIGTATQDDLDDRWNVVRLGGIDRFETAVEIADAIDTSPDTVFVTTGRKFPDALSAGAATADVGAVIVLADEDANGTGQRNTQFTDPYLAQHATATLWAIGGPAAVAYPEAANTLAGESRLGTAVLVAQEFFPAPTDVGIARADNFPDALSGGVHIGHIGGPLVLTQSQDLNAGWGSLNSDAGLLTKYLEDRADTISTGYIYGGTAAISGTVDAQVENAIS